MKTKIKKSDIFWNCVAALSLLVLALCNFTFFLFLFFFIGSIASLIAVLFTIIEASGTTEDVTFDMKPYYIIYVVPAFWLIIGIIYGVYYASKVITKFNKYLNK